VGKKIKKHPWKICPLGSYYVRAHYKTIKAKEHYWSAHCREGKTKKEVLTSDEIKEISKRFENEKLKMPKSYDFKARNGNKYDLLIAGWVKYWTDIFGTQTNITADFVKVLMMTESTFGKKSRAKTHNNSGVAMGLMQITDYTFKLAGEDKKELRDHVFNLKRKEVFEPEVNICLGVRWLFRKRDIAKYYLKKEPTLLQLAEEYKGIRNDKSLKAQKQREKFMEYLKEYRNVKSPKQ
jgi:hypothetical protein